MGSTRYLPCIATVLFAPCFSALAQNISVEEPQPTVRWEAGAEMGAIAGGTRLGVVSGTGKLDYLVAGAHLTGDVSAAKGLMSYRNVANATTTTEYWDGARRWLAGAIVGATNRGTRIGVLSGTGKLDYVVSGAHLTGDVTADGKGRFLYRNVANAMTTSDYWDGARRWLAGAVLGITDKGKAIGVLSGTQKPQ